MTPRQMLLKQLIDQPLHVAWGAVSQVPLLVALHLWGAAPTWGLAVFAGTGALVMCLPRELVDQWPIVRKWDFALDTCMFVAGGAGAGVLFGVL